MISRYKRITSFRWGLINRTPSFVSKREETAPVRLRRCGIESAIVRKSTDKHPHTYIYTNCGIFRNIRDFSEFLRIFFRREVRHSWEIWGDVMSILMTKILCFWEEKSILGDDYHQNVTGSMYCYSSSGTLIFCKFFSPITIRSKEETTMFAAGIRKYGGSWDGRRKGLN